METCRESKLKRITLKTITVDLSFNIRVVIRSHKSIYSEWQSRLLPSPSLHADNRQPTYYGSYSRFRIVNAVTNDVLVTQWPPSNNPRKRNKNKDLTQHHQIIIQFPQSHNCHPLTFESNRACLSHSPVLIHKTFEQSNTQ